MPQRIVLQPSDITRALTRIAHEILESNRGPQGLLLLGIPTRGTVLAERIGRIIARLEPEAPADLVGSLDVTMYRDDLQRNPTRAEISRRLRLPLGTVKDSVSSILRTMALSTRVEAVALAARPGLRFSA